MVHHLQFSPEKFGTVLGYAPGHVAIYSSHYESADPADFPDRNSFRCYLDGIYMGYKWQCVEFARRWLYINCGYVFGDVPMAYDIFALRHVRRVADNALLPLYSFANGSKRCPEPGSLLIWKEGGEFDVTGHVAIITERLGDRIRIAEQNFEHNLLPTGQNWSRELPLHCDADGRYHIIESLPETSILGWVMQTGNAEGATKLPDKDPSLLKLHSKLIDNHGQANQPWLDTSRRDQQAFVTAMGGHFLTRDTAEQYRYFRMSESAEKEVIRATNELHLMFLHATQTVLGDEQLLKRFNIPASLWPRLRKSWNNRRGQMITGRFDFCLSERGLKLYEYNADSASCHMEAGCVQSLWARHFGCDDGTDSAEELFEKLTNTWRNSGVEGTLHIMQDQDKEETYHAQFMKSAIEAAGIRCRVIRGMGGLRWSDAGEVVDDHNEPIRWVWKTWAWETALDQIRAECEADDSLPEIRTGGDNIRLVDVLLRPAVMVFEPFWTLIPSNKAILPVLWSIFPNHPYLLNSQFELTDDFNQRGYVTKPIAGRSGSNISLFDKDDQLLNETEGSFQHQDQIYQELWRLPDIDGYRTQVCTFTVNGSYGGSCVRVDRSLIITTDSDLLPLRIVPDNTL